MNRTARPFDESGIRPTNGLAPDQLDPRLAPHDIEGDSWLSGRVVRTYAVGLGVGNSRRVVANHQSVSTAAFVASPQQAERLART